MELNTKYCRPLKSQRIIELHNNPLTFKVKLNTKSLKNATILPIKMFNGDNLLVGRGGVIDNMGNYCTESGVKDRQSEKYDFENPQHRNEKVVFCGYFIDQWGHFLIECIPRLWFTLNDNTYDKYIFITKGSTKIYGNFLEFFKLLGIQDKVEIIYQPTKFDEVLIPEMSFLKWQYYSQGYLNIINKVIKQASSSTKTRTYNKIFLSRYKFWRAQQFEFGLDMLENFYSKNGYKIIYPERYPLNKLIYYLQNSKDIVTMSGSLAHCALFANNNSNITIIERNTLINNWQININKIKNLNVAYLDAVMPILSVHIMKGPYFVFYNKYMERYAEDMNYLPPKKKYMNCKRELIQQYFKAYKQLYGKKEFFEERHKLNGDLIYEGYNDTLKDFSEFIDTEKITFNFLN